MSRTSTSSRLAAGSESPPPPPLPPPYDRSRCYSIESSVSRSGPRLHLEPSLSSLDTGSHSQCGRPEQSRPHTPESHTNNRHITPVTNMTPIFHTIDSTNGRPSISYMGDDSSNWLHRASDPPSPALPPRSSATHEPAGTGQILALSDISIGLSGSTAPTPVGPLPTRPTPILTSIQPPATPTLTSSASVYNGGGSGLPSAFTPSSLAHQPALIRPQSAYPTSTPSLSHSVSVGHRSSPSINSPFTATSTITPAPAPLQWVSHSNRELVRLVFSKRMQMHRGILEPRFAGLLADSPTPTGKQASPKKSASLSSASSSSPSSSSSTNPLLLHSQLSTASSRTIHISVIGTAACGKTSTLANLTGRPIPHKHMETSGMQWLDIAWPYKHGGSGEVVICDLLFWDVGATAAMQYKYIQTTPEQHSQLCVYVVSSIDKASWTHVQKKLEEDANNDKKKSIPKLIVITKIDDRSKREVTDIDVFAFQDRYNRQYFPSSDSPASRLSYVSGSIVVLKLANWPISTEPFFQRPGVTSIINTIAAMVLTKS